MALGEGIDPRSAPEDEGEERPPREPIYPQGRAMHVPSEAVQLTFLDPHTLPSFRQDDSEGDEGAASGVELKTPLGIRIPVFEGPLDLLLHLIRRDKLDIYDIPLGHITEQYLAMLGLMKILDLDVAGEFMVMAASLMRLKARMLLPTWPEDEDDEDPRTELVQQLLEYRRFKEAAREFREREDQRRRQFPRGFVPAPGDPGEPELAPISHFVLVEVMKDVLSRVGEEFFYSVELEDVTLDEKIELIEAELADKGRALFVDLVSRFPRRMHIVVTFMAILELAKLGRVAVAQESNFGQIWLYPAREGRPIGDLPQGVVIPDSLRAPESEEAPELGATGEPGGNVAADDADAPPAPSAPAAGDPGTPETEPVDPAVEDPHGTP